MSRRPSRRDGRGSPRAPALILLLALSLAGTLTSPLGAQERGEAEPLTKADVIRLLTAGTYSDGEIERIVETSCISFELTDRDRSDFRDLGASAPVIDALESCGSPGLARVELSASPGTLRAEVGDSVSLTVAARRGGQPAGSVPLTLLGTPTRSLRDAPTATTDGEGLARFSVAAGRQSGRRTLEVTASGVEGDVRVTVPLRVTASIPASARLWPPSLTVNRREETSRTVLAMVTDRYGNGVAGTPVVARAGTASSGEVVAEAVTDRQGEALLRVPPGGMDESGELGVWAAGNRVGSVSVQVVGATPVEMRFVDGREQTAGPGERLPEPLVLEVRTPKGEPAAFRRVTFSSREGRVTPESTGTDSAGRAEVEVWTAQDGSPTTVSAEVGESRAELTLAPETAEREAEPSDEAAVSSEQPGATAEDSRRGAAGSVAALRRAAAVSPSDVGAWVDLSRAWREAARTQEARWALLRAREHASGAVRDSVDEALSRVYGLPPGLRVTALGGHTFEQDGTAGLRAAEVRLRAASFLEAWGRYDRSLPTRVPALVRGPDALDAYYGGVEVEWGTPARTVTLLEAGRREYRDVDLAQNVARIEQTVRFPTDLGFLEVRGGGVLGRWFDRDDWVAYARAAIPVALAVDVKPSVWLGETVGTDLSGVGREPGREVRGVLAVEVRPMPRLRIEPSVGYGHVEADAAQATGSLREAGLSASIPISSSTAFELVVRHQSPPGGESFTVLAGGFHVGIR